MIKLDLGSKLLYVKVHCFYWATGEITSVDWLIKCSLKFFKSYHRKKWKTTLENVEREDNY